MNEDNTRVADEVTVGVGKPTNSPVTVEGFVVAELRGPDGELKTLTTTRNLVTAVGDQMYAARASGATSPPAAPTGMRLGGGVVTGGSVPSKTGTGAALTGYLAGSNKPFTSTPTAVGGVASYTRTYAAGEATTASPITEVVIVNDTIATDATSAAAATISRAALAGIGSKGASDSLTVTWTHTVLGS